MDPQAEPKTPAELMQEMRSRFDAANTKAESGRQERRDHAATRQRKIEQGEAQADPAAQPDDVGANDAPGG